MVYLLVLSFWMKTKNSLKFTEAESGTKLMERLELDHKFKPDILMHFLLSYITAHNHSDVYYQIILQVHLWAAHKGRVPALKTAKRAH